jgi:YbbR domain-containing protein
MLENWQYRILAVILAVSCWYLLTGREKVDVWMEIPVELVSAPSQLHISEGLRNRIDVRLRGPKSIVRGLEPKDIAYTLDLSGLSEGQSTIVFQPDNVPVSNAVEVMEFDPPRLVLQIEPLVDKMVPVAPRWEGEIHDAVELRRVGTVPRNVTLTGPKSILSGVKEAPTAAISVNATGEQIIENKVGLVLDESLQSEPSEVEVTLSFGIKREEVWAKIPVTVRTPEGISAKPSPGIVQLHLNTPVTLLRRKDFKENIRAIVDIGNQPPPGSARYDYIVEMPETITLLKKVPEQVEITFGKKAGKQQ